MFRALLVFALYRISFPCVCCLLPILANAGLLIFEPVRIGTENSL